MTSATTEGLKPKLLDLVAQGQAEKQTFIARLSDAQHRVASRPQDLTLLHSSYFAPGVTDVGLWPIKPGQQ